MSDQKAYAVAVSILETRISLRAEFVSVKPLAYCSWDDREVIALKQDGPWDTRELLFVGLGGEFKPKSV
ncbi:hypothetical protein SJI00_07455 [Pseudomonas sp. RP23018S]|uniref:hypothetical protein n=1 Tax=Pseudomonas sp. RP23018S TaxID=3096037 RepID=UPI002ACA6983|nr:hypothetical protein [Pseudomonas sp. RP23018S]MDZ5602607.1 hypothetical protein [Pseudomonas sp. RP23018S]